MLRQTQLSRAVEFIHSHHDRNISVAELAAAAGVSKGNFVRAFTRAMGTSPHRYLLEKRIDRARSLLVDDGYSLADVALKSGFCSQSHFTTLFRRETGFTPGVFRTERVLDR